MDEPSIHQDSSDEIMDFNEEWLYCLRANELSEAVEMLKERLVTDVNAVDQNGNGALHYCCANNLGEAVVFLLKECKLDYCRVNNNGNTPLQWAVQTNSMEAAQQLLIHDYNVHRAEYVTSDYYKELELVALRDEFKLDEATKSHYNILEYSNGYAENNKINLMTKNVFGKSILNDAFNAKDQNILHAILEHPAAAVLDEQNQDEQTELPVERMLVNGVNGVVHAFQFTAAENADNRHPEVKARELEIKDEDILNSKCAELDRSGEVIWETDLVAAQWLTALAKDGKFKGKKVLQLGSGCGLSAIAMYVSAMFYGKKPKELMFTDVSKHTMNNLIFNVELNRLHEQGGISINTLDWTNEDSWPKKPEGGLATFDIIVGSDLVYDENLVMPLANTISGLLDGQRGELFYVFKAERQGSNLIPEALQKLGFDVQMQQAPKRYLVNPLTSNDDRVIELFFPELKTDDFTMLHARRK